MALDVIGECRLSDIDVFEILFLFSAFSMMIVLAIIRLAEGKAEGHPPVADFSGIPTLFGVCVWLLIKIMADTLETHEYDEQL